MKKILYSLVALMIFATPLFADLGDERSLGNVVANGSTRWRIDSTALFPGTDSAEDIGKSTAYVENIYADAIHTKDAKTINLPLTSFVLETPADITASTAPGLEQDNSIPALVWADGETTTADITFRVPDSYESGAGFRIIASNGSLASTDANQLAWGFFENTVGSAWDTAVWNDTPLDVEGDSTPDLVTISESTVFSNISAGSLVTLKLWRFDGGTTGTADMEIYAVDFYYTD